MRISRDIRSWALHHRSDQVVEQGYTIHDRLLRPARVVVCKWRTRTEPEIDDSDLGAE
jgi:hypothetical protein